MKSFLHRHLHIGAKKKTGEAVPLSRSNASCQSHRAEPLKAVSFRSSGISAFALLAIGAVSFGAIAVGALAIGRLVLGKLFIRSARIDRLEIGELNVRSVDFAGNKCIEGSCCDT
jgi:hypothetical protein